MPPTKGLPRERRPNFYRACMTVDDRRRRETLTELRSGLVAASNRIRAALELREASKRDLEGMP